MMFYKNSCKIYLCIGLIMLMFSALTCSEKNEDAPPYNQVHPESWYNPQFLNEPPFHGTDVKTNGSLACMQCHDIYGQGKENIPGCFKCHFGPEGSRAPAGSDWTHGLVRHEGFEGEQDVCNTCHEVGRSFETGPGICHNCHDVETHVLGQPWLDSSLPDYHGNQPQQDCASCHDLAVRCIQCHFGESGSKSPIGSGWPHGVIDGHNDRENSIDTCNQCHGLTRTYRNEPAGCHDCHDD